MRIFGVTPFSKLQNNTEKNSKEQHSMRIFGVTPFSKLQNNT